MTIGARWAANRRGVGEMPPLMDGLELYLDSSLGVTLNGSTVSSWADQSGNGRDFAQGTASKQPTFNASDSSLGGRPSLSFDGTNDCLTRASAFAAMSNVTIYLVAREFTGTFWTSLLASNTYAAAGFFSLVMKNSTVPAAFFCNPGNTESSRDFGAITAGGPARLTAVGTFGAGGAVWSTYTNGAASGATALTNATAGSSSVADAAIGSDFNGLSGFAQSTYGAVLIYNTAHTATDVAAMDAYLKRRFKL